MEILEVFEALWYRSSCQVVSSTDRLFAVAKFRLQQVCAMTTVFYQYHRVPLKLLLP